MSHGKRIRQLEVELHSSDYALHLIKYTLVFHNNDPRLDWDIIWSEGRRTILEQLSSITSRPWTKIKEDERLFLKQVAVDKYDRTFEILRAIFKRGITNVR